MCMFKCVYLKWTCWFCVVTAEEEPTDPWYSNSRKKRVLAMDGWKWHGKHIGDEVRLRGFLKEWRCISGKEENTWLADWQELKNLKVCWCEKLQARRGFGLSQVNDTGHAKRWCWNICPESCTVCLLNFWLSPTNPYPTWSLSPFFFPKVCCQSDDDHVWHFHRGTVAIVLNHHLPPPLSISALARNASLNY